jgi:F1F0 ATPase subunit 2
MEDTMVTQAAVFIGGLLTGGSNYLGLWLTVKKVAGSGRPARLVLSSMLLRIAACVVLFYLLMDSRGERLVPVLAGFYLARILACRRFGVSPGTSLLR